MVKALRAKKKIDEGFDGEGAKNADARSFKERRAEKDVAMSAFADLGNNTKDGGGVMGAFLKSKAKAPTPAPARDGRLPEKQKNAAGAGVDAVDIGGLGGEERLKAAKDKRKSKKSKTGSKGSSKNTGTERTSEDEVFEE